MTAYAAAHLRSVDFGPEIMRYLQGIDATLAEFGGAGSWSTAPTRK